jgi:predicted  nucleic acid-binding Zn-ribbon protein
MSPGNKLLNIEILDIEIARLEKSKFEYPKKLSELKGVIAQKEKKLSLAKKDLEKIERDISSVSIDLDVHKKELAQSYERLNTVKNNKEYDAVQKEIRKRKSLLEEMNHSIVKFKEKLPLAQEEFRVAQEEFEGIKAENTPVVEDLTQKIASIDNDILAKLSEKKDLSAEILPTFLNVYNLILPGRKKSGKTLSHILPTGRICSYCGQLLSPNVMKKILTSTAPIVCENCGSLFVLLEVEDSQENP